MDNHDKMMSQLFMEEEAHATTKRQKQLLMLVNLLLPAPARRQRALAWWFEGWEDAGQGLASSSGCADA
jgi:hypothetical protein